MEKNVAVSGNIEPYYRMELHRGYLTIGSSVHFHSQRIAYQDFNARGRSDGHNGALKEHRTVYPYSILFSSVPIKGTKLKVFLKQIQCVHSSLKP